MIRALLPLVLLAAPAAAAERSVTITNFDRIRVDGPFEVQVATGGTPLATVSGDGRALDLIEIRVDGGTLVVRPNRNVWAERGTARGVAAPVIRLQTRDLRSLGVVGDGRLNIAGPVRSQRLDITLTGNGSIIVPGLAVDQLQVTLLGTGKVALGGTARSARLVANGAGAIAAKDLIANDVIVRTEGLTAVGVTARYTALANSSGKGPIEILGQPDCKGKAQSDGPITCGGKPLPAPKPF